MKKLQIIILFNFLIFLSFTVNAYDYGDVPSSYLIDHLNDDARHTISNIYLGTKIDEEKDSSTYNHYSDMSAYNDDESGVDDEDGIIGIDNETFFSAATNSYKKTVELSVTTSKSCNLSAWIDWNVNNNWEESEKILSDRVLSTGVNIINIDVPTGDENSLGLHDIIADTRNAEDKKTYARFRCTTQNNIDYWGIANDGEVEDYQLKIHALGLIKGKVYQDVNLNLSFDENDIELNSVEVELLDSTNQIIKTVSTDETGTYIFPDLEMNENIIGNYKVRVKPNQSGVLENLCTLKDILTVKEANLNELNRVVIDDFGYVPYGEIGNYVWIDLNGNEIKDEGEPPLPNVKIIINKENEIEEVLTDENGLYKFKKLSPKQYSVKVDDNSLLDSFSRTTTDKYLVNILPNGKTAIEINSNLNQYEGQFMNKANFGYKPIGKIGDYVWKDENNDTKQDYFEKGIAGVVINLFDNNGNKIATKTTDKDGKYLFESLLPNTYFVEIEEKNNNSLKDLKKSTPNTNKIEVNLSNEKSNYLDADFGYYGNASIGDYVWKDLNEDSIQDPNEIGISDVTIALYIDSNGNEKIDSDESVFKNTTTNIEGYYSFTNLEPNNYIIKVTDFNDKLSSYIQTTSSDKANKPLHSVIALRSGENYINADFGYKPPFGAIGDCVWIDENMNKIKDDNEEGLEGIWVQLESDNGFSQQTQTKKDCTYIFEDLPIDNYKISILQKSKGFDYTTDKNYKINLGQGENNFNADFGLYKKLIEKEIFEIKPSTVIPLKTTEPPNIPTIESIDKPKIRFYNIGDCVWHDENRDGKQNNGEKGLSDVLLELTNQTENIKRQTKTDENCFYEFRDLPSGKYKIKVISKLDNYKPTTPETKNVIIKHENNYNADFGYYIPKITIKPSAPPKTKTNIILSKEIPQTGYNPKRAVEGFSASSIFPEIDIKNPYYDYVLFLYIEELLSKNNIFLEKEISLKDASNMIIKGLELSENKLNKNKLKEFLKSKGILTSKTKFILHNHSFDSPITYERTMLLIARLANLVNDENKSTMGNWQETYYKILSDRNLIPRNFKNNKNWQQILNRGDFFSFLYRVIQRKQSKTKSYINQFKFSMPKQNIKDVPTRRTLLNHPDNWVEKLKKGAAFFEDKENNRLIVFAHSSNFPGETNPIIRFFGKIFNSLIGNVHKNDLISIKINDYKINYRVTEIEKVAGNEISALKKKDENDLIVFTCDKDPQYRWIIRAQKSQH